MVITVEFSSGHVAMVAVLDHGSSNSWSHGPLVSRYPRHPRFHRRLLKMLWSPIVEVVVVTLAVMVVVMDICQRAVDVVTNGKLQALYSIDIAELRRWMPRDRGRRYLPSLKQCHAGGSTVVQ